MTRPLGLLLLLLMHSTVYAQKTSGIEPEKSPSLIKTIDSLNKLVEETYVSAPYEARVSAEHALLLSEKIKYNEGTGAAFLNLSLIHI